MNKGDLLIFPGKLYHEGVAITNGIRYILTGFLKIKPMENHYDCYDLMIIYRKREITITNHLNKAVMIHLAMKDSMLTTKEAHFIEPNKWITITTEMFNALSIKCMDGFILYDGPYWDTLTIYLCNDCTNTLAEYNIKSTQGWDKWDAIDNLLGQIPDLSDIPIIPAQP